MKLTVANIRKCPKENVMCGSSFFCWVGILAVVFPSWWLLPVYISVSFELIRYSSDRDNLLSKIIFIPGYLVQLILTREPTDEQLRVGLRGINAILHSK